MGHMGPGKSDTFFKWYLSNHVIIDVQAIFLGQMSHSDLLKQIGKMHLRQDSRLPQKLTEAQRRAAWEAEPEIAELWDEIQEMGRDLKDTYGTIAKGDNTPQGRDRKVLLRNLKSRRKMAEIRKFRELLRNFHDTADLDHIVAQLRGEETLSYSLQPIDLVLDDRRWLADALFEMTNDVQFGHIVDHMARLAHQCEDVRPEHRHDL